MSERRAIVGALINGRIVTNNWDLIRQSISSGAEYRLLEQREMQFMASCDLGINWEKMAASPVKFYIEGDTLLPADEIKKDMGNG